MVPVRILGICGSLRRGSYNAAALRAAVSMAPADVAISVFDLRDLPQFDADLERDAPPRVRALREAVHAADGVLIASPEHNYSFPGVLKTALDWASRPAGQNAWKGRPAAILGASTGNIATARMQFHLRQVLVALDMPAVLRPEVLIGRAAEKFAPDGTLTDEPTAARIRELVDALARMAREAAARRG